MVLAATLITLLAILIGAAIHNGHTQPAPQPATLIAPSATLGALRVARARLARGEIDFSEYLRIGSVLRG